MCDLHEAAENLKELEQIQDDPRLIPESFGVKINFAKMGELDNLKPIMIIENNEYKLGWGLRDE